jgi:DNA gyrase subunit A
VTKSALVERIADVVLSRKLPQLLDVRDVSTDDVRIELELKRDADERMVMAYLFKHTPLQTNFNVNLTCLIPTENPEVGRPERLDLKAMLWHFLHFRLDVVTRRLEHEREALTRRMHILDGFAKVFDALDEILRLIRRSEGKADAAEQIMRRFDLDAEQTDAILELKVYRLARLEILIIRKELTEKRARAGEIEGLLVDEDRRWALVREEIEQIQHQYGGKADLRRTTFADDQAEVEYSADDFIVEEDNVVILSQDGWVKRQKEVKDLASTRLREGDRVVAAQPGSTRAGIVFFTNFGIAYTCRIIDVPASTGYGEPIQRLFKFKDGERVVAAVSLDPRLTGPIQAASEGVPPPLHALAVTSDGYSLRFGLEGFAEPSTRSGRRYARPAEAAEVVGVVLVRGDETVLAATKSAHAMVCGVEEVNYLAGPGKGVILVKLRKGDDRVLGFTVVTGDRQVLTVETSRGALQTINTGKYEATGRGGRGRELLQRGEFVRVVPEEVPAPPALAQKED